MTKSHTKLMFAQSMFLKLLLSFLLIIVILSLFYAVSYNFLIKSVEEEIVINASERLDNIVSKVEKELIQLKSVMLRMSQESFFQSIAMGDNIPPYIQKLVSDAFASYSLFTDYNFSYVDTIFILSPQTNDTVMTFESTYDKNTFFKLFYYNSIYNEDFWKVEMDQNFVFKFYPLDPFVDKSQYVYKTDVSQLLMPIALKTKKNSHYIMVALIDIEGLLRSIDGHFAESFAILSPDNTVLYSSINDVQIEDIIAGNNGSYIKTDEGYIFIQESYDNRLTYCRLLSKAKLKDQLNKTNTFLRLITVVSLISSILISLYIVKRFNDPVRQIVSILEQYPQSNQGRQDIENLGCLRDSIQELIDENSSYYQELKSKDSMLEKYSYQASIKNIYPGLKKQLDVKNDYFILYFKVHFKPAYYENILSDHELALYSLSEVIQCYVETCFQDSVTIHVESDAIVSVINVYEDTEELDRKIGIIAEKLKNEEEYLFFTIAFSEVYQDISQLSDAYNRVIKISEHRPPMPTIEILSEVDLHTSCNKFYFLLEQEEQLLNLLYNCEQQECIHLINNILEYNVQKGVNCLYVRALCYEIANSCIKVLVRSYYDVPKDIELSSIYFNIRQCFTIGDFKYVLEEFVVEVIDYINTHKKQDDYIVDNIISYIEENYAEDIYLDLLAEKLNLTSNYISAYFKDKVGMSLNDYINDFRIRKSIELLESTFDKVKDISAQVGFTNVNTFNRVFKKYTGKTPTEYRRQLIIN